VVNNHRAKLLLGGIADAHTLETTSRLLGDQAVWELARSRQPRGRSTATEATGYRPLLSVDELRRLPRLCGVLVYGALRPARVRLRPWFARGEQRRRARQTRQLVPTMPAGQAAPAPAPAPASVPVPAAGRLDLADLVLVPAPPRTPTSNSNGNGSRNGNGNVDGNGNGSTGQVPVGRGGA
jgi:type IV secretory pathway TraG/TraD family ATPase VirD4